MINESFDTHDISMDNTPNKKRKREICSKFVSSTPIKINANNKENFMLSDSLCMEVKSIAEIVAEKNITKQRNNDFEVIRKPPKKKKKKSEECCFVNPGLDLKVDEKLINPYEVVRSDNTEAIIVAQGVTNPALDTNLEPKLIAGKTLNNPFEVKRLTEYVGTNACGFDNSALDLNGVVHTPLVLSLPFTPTVNHRIDFSNMPENLTPSALFSSKLVLENVSENVESKISVMDTPKRNATLKSRKSLSVISEEAEIDIGEELDNYQLQLENSINEAKIQNRKYVFDAPKSIAEENEETEESAGDIQVDEKSLVNNGTYTKEILKIIEESTKDVHVTNIENGIMSGLKETDVDSVDNDVNDDHNEDVQFEEVDSFDDDFGKLGQFKRAYRTDAPKMFQPPAPVSVESSKKTNLGSTIRRSIRKFMHPKDKVDRSEDHSENEKHEGIFQSIRHSLRRKPKPSSVNLENSVMGRQVFRETSNIDLASKKTLERKTIKRQVIKNVKTFMESVEEFNHF